ncbi:short-chain dehydrogenase [Bacteroidota bacterium]|nr:short-chain dehydrogenase [Bacteroidota bacterium]
MNMDKLNGKVAFITGGNKGIGLGVAEAMVEAGMFVCITGRNEADLQAAEKKLNAIRDNSTLGIVCDVRSLSDQQVAVQQIMDKWKQLDVVIANAGVGHFADISLLTPEQWHETIDINLTGVFNTVKASLDPLKASKGYLITIASLAGTNFFAAGAAYNASKFGLVGFTQAVMLDVRKHGIKTTTIMPGSVSTYFNNHTPNDADHWKIQPEDMGQMVVDLLLMPHRTLPSKIEVRPTMPG